MRCAVVLVSLLPVLLPLPQFVEAQDNPGHEIEIHKNVKLIEMTARASLPAELNGSYLSFLPLLEEVLRENTTEQPPECALTVRVVPGTKEVGSTKVTRALARVTAFRKNSKNEFMGTLILYSYATNGPLSKEETKRFLKLTVLDPAKCAAITE